MSRSFWEGVDPASRRAQERWREDQREKREAAEEEASAEEAAPSARTRLLEASDIFAPLPPIAWVCQPLDMAPGAPTLIAGYGFSGKTVAAQDFALAIATGSLAWGRFSTRRGRVLHVDYEQGQHLTKLRYQRLARARGIDPRELEGWIRFVSFPNLYLDDPADPFTGDKIAVMCGAVDFMLIDSFRAACPRTDENSSEARIPLDRLTRASENAGTTVMVLHHARKTNGGSSQRMAIRGSGALFDACASVLVFNAGDKKGDPVSVTHEKARITGRTIDEFALGIEDVEVDGDPRAGLRVAATTAIKKRPTSDEFEKLKTQIVTLIRSEGGVIRFGSNVITKRLKMNNNKKPEVTAALDDLVGANTLIRTGAKSLPVYTLPGAGSGLGGLGP